MMFAQGCLASLLFLLFPIVLGQSNVFKPGYNFQNLGRQTNPTSHVVPGKPNVNNVLNFGKAAIQPKDKSNEEIPHIDVMDFFVPAYPYIGEDFELTCGYKHQDGLALQRIEWHRNKVNDFHLCEYFQISLIFR